MKTSKGVIKMDEGGLADIMEAGISKGPNLAGAAGASSTNSRWDGFIAPFNSLFVASDLMLVDCEKTSEMIGFSKPVEEFLKNNVDPKVEAFKDLLPKANTVKVKEIGESIDRRLDKMSSYWAKGNKKNALYIACGIAAYMSVCKKLRPYAYTFTRVSQIVDKFGILVKSRFKRLISEASDLKITKEEDFLGVKVLDSVLEIADNWNTFVGNL